MDRLDGNEMDLSQAKTFVKKGTVRAFLNKDGATYRKAWGDQDFPGAHYVIVGPDGDIYGCAVHEFERTYRAVPDQPDTYRKAASIRAVCMKTPFEVTNVTRDGNLEAIASGQAGDWLVEQTGGDRQLIEASAFSRLYEEE